MRRVIWLLAVLALAGAACGDSGSPATTGTGDDPVTTETTAAETTTSTAADTTTTTAAAADELRIVSLTGDITEILFELGFGDNVVGVDVTTTHPPEAAEIPVIGFGQMLAAEPVLALQPTHVIGDASIAPPEALEQLESAGVEVVILEAPPTLDGPAAKIGQLAGLLGVPDAGAELIGRVTAEIEAARAIAAEADTEPRVAYVYLRGPETIFLFGAGMPTQAMIEGAGAVDVGAELLGGPAPLTPEALVAAAPEIIILPEAGLGALGGIEAFEAIPGVAETPAAETDSYLVYDEAFFFNLGPRAGQALMQLVTDLYPDLAS